MLDAEMYTGMTKSYHSFTMDRGIALHKMIRLITFSAAGGGYLNFMGNEFGHPEWIDFPREGNNWSYKYARRQWHLADNDDLKYTYLVKFDNAMVRLHREFRMLDDIIVNRIYENNWDKVLAFTRGEFLMVFNFHPTNSFTDYGIPIKGKFRIIVDSDDPEFGGFNRINRNQIYMSTRKASKITLDYPLYLYLYLPSRTALVLKAEPVRKATEI
jgi:1,4-alpha-glucan branching enzyme